MEEIKNTLTNDKQDFFDFYSLFTFVENVQEIKDLNPQIELCIIQTEFTPQEISTIQSLKMKHKETEFWLCSNNLSKKNILIAQKLDVKTVVPIPVEQESIEEYFINKHGTNLFKDEDNNWDYSETAGLKIMIVDDNKMNIELLEEILCKFKLEIDSFTKPKEALSKLTEKKFDLFLLDIMMPDMSGFELAEKIKANKEYENIPIIFISALSDSQNKIKSYNLGSHAYVEKPFDVNVLRTQIFNLLKTQKSLGLVTSNKENFMAAVAHDLKTPIRAGINALNLLLNRKLGELEEPQHEIVEDLLNSTKYMQDMVENILCKSRIENSNINISKQIYSASELVKHCIDITKYITIPKKQKIKFQCNLNNTLIPLDYVEMKRAIHNIIANASAYSPSNSDIIIEVFKEDKNLGISIQDFGQGIEIKNQNEVFNEYMTHAKKYKTVGSGLGLFITKKIIEAHGGEIKLQSKPGYGTKIIIYLPFYEKK